MEVSSAVMERFTASLAARAGCTRWSQSAAPVLCASRPLMSRSVPRAHGCHVAAGLSTAVYRAVEERSLPRPSDASPELP
jgi:hypothetical protein